MTGPNPVSWMGCTSSALACVPLGEAAFIASPWAEVFLAEEGPSCQGFWTVPTARSRVARLTVITVLGGEAALGVSQGFGGARRLEGGGRIGFSTVELWISDQNLKIICKNM